MYSFFVCPNSFSTDGGVFASETVFQMVFSPPDKKAEKFSLLAASIERYGCVSFFFFFFFFHGLPERSSHFDVFFLFLCFLYFFVRGFLRFLECFFFVLYLLTAYGVARRQRCCSTWPYHEAAEAETCDDPASCCPWHCDGSHDESLLEYASCYHS